uniref:Uncharacterized protein n=1 Tax=Magallana gigas TaxID=29159 RepID=K1QV19_MAGGI
MFTHARRKLTELVRTVHHKGKQSLKAYTGHINGEGRNAGVETEEYVPSSVIHPSVEKARNPSYLEAVGDYGEKDEEFPVPSFESEYKSLPDPHKPAFRTRSAPMVEDEVFSDDQQERSQSMRHSEPNPAHLDQAGMYSAPLKPTRSARSQGKNRNSRKSKSTTGWSPQSSVLSVPSGEDGKSSDSESVISTGPMLDDEQVLALTLDFEKVSTDDASPPVNLNWRRKSLPPNLSHLEQFLHKSVDDENV